MLTNTANLLTLFRIFVIPILVVLFFFIEQSETIAWVTLVIYGLAAITDFFDGYMARVLGQTSAFGKFLDPIADKLLVTVMLFLLIAFDRLEGIWIIPALVILIREIVIAGLREFLGPYNVQVPVTKLAKWKTMSQMFALGFILMGSHGIETVKYTVEIGQYGLLFAAILTVITGWAYLSVGYKTIVELDAKDTKTKT